MGGFHHRCPSQDEVDTYQFANPSSDTHSNWKVMCEVAEEKRNCLNSKRWEWRAKEKLGELKGKVEDLEMDVKTISSENKTLHEQVEDLAGQNTKLKQEVRCLTTRFNSHVRWEPQKIKTAVRQALSTIFVAQQTIYKVKTPNGTIQNWAQSIILHLVCASDVPVAKTWAAFSCITEGLGVPVEGSWSARSAGHIVLEGALAVEEMIVEDFANALGKSIDSLKFI